MEFNTGDLVYVTDYPGHIAAVQGSAACDMHPGEDHESYLVLDPMGDEHWACQEDLEQAE